ncbi:uncharacterized protein RCC_03853 [Ramularia collo-cygni]|uniref:Uncharacterized protein n=1 Tax=Ramularia collo-cygni TaxID=112498 RepID=A0A2D3UV45_9PEZI|nr:uncharacterized protein RCC_03853 [Ramularia collo-cygni]CZT18015.1 uncharacterized protein RCC_03853 [Ramularia collo-cygni]
MAPLSPTTTNPFPNDNPNDSDSHQFTAEQRFHGAYSYALVHMRSNMRLENPAFMIPTYSMLVAWKPTITKMEWAALAHDIKAGSEDFAPYVPILSPIQCATTQVLSSRLTCEQTRLHQRRRRRSHRRRGENLAWRAALVPPWRNASLISCH